MISITQAADIENKKGQVIKSAAEIYESFFVPALFKQWPPLMAELLGLSRGQRVLDVACGTGVVARHFLERLGDPELVHAVDINVDMLEIARQKSPDVLWHQGAAEELSFDDNCFDHVVCQFGLMFFQNRSKAIQEMIRVLQPGGKLAVAVWDKLEKSPGYKTVVDILQELFGNEIANEIRAPFVLGDKEKLKKIIADAGIADFEIHTKQGVAQFPGIDDWMFTDIKGWTLADVLSDRQFEQFTSVASNALQQYTDNNGAVRFAAPAHVIIVKKH